MTMERVSSTEMIAATRAYRVLLVEDNPAEAELVFERLSAASPAFEITHALDMERAAKACGASSFDCIVLDLQLPDTGGVETIRTMRAQSPDAAIVAYSGMDDEGSRSASLREGAQDFISKNGPEAGSLDRSILFALERWRALKLHQQLQDLFAAIPDAMIVCGPDGVIRFANPAAIALLEGGGTLVGKMFEFDLGEPVADVEIEQGGVNRVCEMRVAACNWDNEACQLAAIRDVTDQRALAGRLRQLNKIELIGLFAGGMAHDFGNIISCIDVVAELGQRTARADLDAFNRFAEIRTTTEAGRAIVRKLLSLEQSKVSSPERVNLREVMGETVKLLRQVLPKEIKLECKCADKLSPVLMDRSHIEQALLNLAFNARDAMIGGGVLRVECEDCVEPGDFVRISVHDTGCGIANDDLPHIFELFFTTKGAGGGSGIGLPICQAMIEHAGGAIKVASRLGEGSTFSIFLPKHNSAIVAATNRSGTERFNA